MRMPKRLKDEKNNLETSSSEQEHDEKKDQEEEEEEEEGQTTTNKEPDLYSYEMNTLLSALNQEIAEEGENGNSIYSSSWPGSQSLIDELRETIAKEKELPAHSNPEKAEAHANKIRNMETMLDWISGENGRLPSDGCTLWVFEGTVKTESNGKFWKRWWPAGRSLEVCAITGRAQYHAKLRHLEVRSGDRPHDPGDSDRVRSTDLQWYDRHPHWALREMLADNDICAIGSTRFGSF
ncbi:hypothetical protein QBC43DRAFT_11992 [Cladorrhinum sp. PSN259]|nr:hypothetical protein QBC43DRAFT_11992 [Cladorrhinum sp. PSN259]